MPAKAASVIGLRVPAAKGATVRGMRAADISLHRIVISDRFNVYTS